MKESVFFPAEGGATLSAWLLLPKNATGKLAAITMAHGFGLTKFHSLEPIAQSFADAGFAVLLHDHRGFGESGGMPRHDVNPWRQISDWRRAISYLQSRAEVNAERIGLWGTSYAGGHAIVLGATDRRLKAVVASVPTTDGFATGLRRLTIAQRAELEDLLSLDERAQLAGADPAIQLLVSADFDRAACYRSPEAIAFYLQDISTDVWANKVTLRSTRWAQMYRPGSWVKEVSPTPLLMMVAEQDHVTGTDLALEVYEQALDPKKLVMTCGGHFDQYGREFAACTAESIEWFKAYL